MQANILFIRDEEIPAGIPLLSHAFETYASESNKNAAVFLEFAPAEMNFRPHERSQSPLEIMQHELLSQRRFFFDFIGTPELPASEVLPEDQSSEGFAARLLELTRPRLTFLAAQNEAWWLERRRFFDVDRERIWIFWRRILHSAHHRTQLTVCLRLLDRKVPAIYGPTADVTWANADPTHLQRERDAR